MAGALPPTPPDERYTELDRALQTASHELHTPPRGPVVGRLGVVASGQAQASLAGIDVLRAGGNAFDATITVSAMLVVLQPYASHLGGDGFALIRTAQGETMALNAGGRAPLAATPDRFPEGIPQRGPTAVAVPGLVDAWLALHKRFASKPLRDLLAPAIALARDGFPLSQRLAFVLRSAEEVLAADAGCREAFLSDGPPRPGAWLRQPDLARTLEAIAAGGRGAFYEGEVGDRIVALMRERGGLIGREDLARDQAVWDEPLTTTYRGWRVFEQPAPSQGLIVLEALNILEGFDIGLQPITSPERVHVTVEAVRLAFEDRRRYLADPAAVEVPVQRLVSKEHAAERRTRIGTKAGAAPVRMGGGDTTSFAVADGGGNLVSFIQSIFHPWGAAVLVPGTGVLLNDRMCGFSLDPSSPNVLRPGMRTVHTLNTWLLEREDGRVYAGGTPGADFQVQVNAQVLSALVDSRLDAQTAIDAPKWALAGPGELAMEARFPEETLAELERRGHRLRRLAPWEALLCRSQLVARDPGSGTLLGASDLRSEGCALSA